MRTQSRKKSSLSWMRRFWSWRWKSRDSSRPTLSPPERKTTIMTVKMKEVGFIIHTYNLPYPKAHFDRFCCIPYVGSQLHFWMKQQYWGWDDRYRVVYPHIHILESIAFALLFAFGFSSPSTTACLWNGFPISRKVNDKIFSFCDNNYPQNFWRTIFVSSK